VRGTYMARQLVVVVHGVGVKQAGVSSDLLAAGLQEDGMVPVASDDFHILEDEAYDDGNRRNPFPCRMRKFRNNGNERIVADFYWGDISNVGSGALGLIIGIIKTVFGIGHAIRENAIELYGAKSWLLAAADHHVRLIHGPIAAINLVMLVGVGINWFTGYTAARNITGLSEFVGAYAGFVTVLLTAIFAVWRYRSHRSFLGRHLWGWVLITCAVLFISEVANLRENWRAWFEQIDAAVASFLCKDPPEHVAAAVIADRAACDPGAGPCPTPRQVCENYLSSGIFVSGGRLLTLANLFWLFVIAIDLVLVVGTAIQAARGKLVDVPILAPVGACGMTLFWLLFLAFVWTAPNALGWTVLPHPRMLESGLALATAAAGILVLLIVAALVVVWRKIRRSREPSTMPVAELQNWYFGKDGIAGEGILQAESNRLIISPWFGWVFVGGIVVLAICVAAITLDTTGLGQAFAGAPGALASWTVDQLRGWSSTVLALFGIVGVVVFGTFRRELQSGIEILTDVITYLNDYSWRWGGSVPARTLLERLPFAKRAFGRSGAPSPGYWPRQRIQDRLRRLVDRLLETEKPDQLVFVAHSQGTVVAHDVIRRWGETWMRKSAGRVPPKSMALVTMGSPLTHIHGHYFPSSFPLLEKGDGKLAAWTNIFRVDDFVGTHVDQSAKWPSERPVPPGGHTYYWIDKNVIEHLREALAITGK